MKLRELLKGIDYIKIEGLQDRPVNDLHYDSRKVTPGSLFFCIKGLTVDGHDYTDQAVSKGAKTLVLERDVAIEGDVTKVFVPNSRTLWHIWLGIITRILPRTLSLLE